MGLRLPDLCNQRLYHRQHLYDNCRLAQSVRVIEIGLHQVGVAVDAVLEIGIRQVAILRREIWEHPGEIVLPG